MVTLPIFDSLDVDGFGLFPGTARTPGLHITFEPGLTLILGANGLGKTTLITLIYRMLTGPWDIPGLAGRGSLGNINLSPTKIPNSEQRLFAQRVADGANTATACLTFKLGDHVISVERSLRTLALKKFLIDEEAQVLDEKSSYQTKIAELSGVWSFGDWILLLRNMVFYFEDRRSLVWDPSAQRQLLRALFLPAATAQKWTEDERKILALDSAARNLQFAITREESQLTSTEQLLDAGEEVREELKALQALHSVDSTKREDLDELLLDLEARRATARLRFVKAEQEREALYRELERAKLIALEARFPQQSETARYIFAQLITESDCLVCGNHVPKAARELERRISKDRCIICDSDVSTTTTHIPEKGVADKRVSRASAKLEAFEPELQNATNDREAIEQEHNDQQIAAATLDKEISKRSQRIDALVRRLPPEEAALHRQRDELSVMRGRLAGMRADLTKLRRGFSKLVALESKAMVKRSLEIKKAFDTYANGFLLERCVLVWSPQKARVGQTGEAIEFPAYQLELTGANFASAVRRSGPEEVSESQREFIDLAFRMSLIQVAANQGVGCLVIDAPESSLDAVFVGRAASVLAKFSTPAKGNRLIVTSNLIEGNLIPELLIRSTPEKKRLTRLVDLLSIAEPTAAVRELRDEYRAIYSRVVRQVKDAANKPAKQRRRK